MELSTLTSLLNYIGSNTDTLPGHMLLYIKSPTEVQLMSASNVDRKREVLAIVNARVPGFEDEIGRPASMCVLRLKEGEHGPLIALHDADAASWEVAATMAIYEYLAMAISKIGYSISAHIKSWELVEILAPTNQKAGGKKIEMPFK